MICHLCSEKYYDKFLYGYKGYSTCSVEKIPEANSSNVNVETANDSLNSISGDTIKEEACDECKSSEQLPDQKGEKQKSSGDKKCILLEEKVDALKKFTPSTMFMLQGWREQLCKCPDCITKYKELSDIGLCRYCTQFISPSE